MLYTDEDDNDFEPEDDASEGDVKQFQVSVSTDRDGFLRRTCPACGRDFKTAINDADLSYLLHSEIQRIGRDLGVSLGEDDTGREETILICPYCSHRAAANDMLAEDLVQYLKKHVYREVLPMINDALGGLADDFPRGGFISISVSYSRSSLPPRPIHGPEPADMKIISFLCCGERAKIAETWNLLEQCPYCGETIAIT